MSQHEALTLGELGYRVFPLTPGQKTPLVNAWVEHASSDYDQIALWVLQYPTANWAIATDGLIVIDVDPGAEHWPDNEAHANSLLATPVIARTPRGGRHYYFRQPDGANLRNTQNGQLAEHVDTRANGGYVAASPSIVNEKPYQWVAGEIDTRPEDLPIVPKWVLDKLARHRRNEPAAAASDEEPVGEGKRNGRLTSLAGAIRRQGCDRATVLVALSHFNNTRCNPPVEQKEVDAIADWVVKFSPAEVRHAIPHGDEDLQPEQSIDDPGPLPDDLLHVPGFIADVVAYNLAGAHKAQPVLALAGALSLLATLTGRKITDTQGTRTNLYCVGLAGTSTGKQRAREVNKEILFRAGLDRMIGPESLGSSQGLVNAVAANPSVLFQLDEIGRYLKTMNQARDAHLFNIISVLMRMFTDSASFYKSDAVADVKRTLTINSPNACVYGTSTFEAFYDALTIDSLQDGFLSRVLIFEGDNDAKRRYIENKPELPSKLVEVAAWWGNFQPGGNMAHANPQPLVIQSTASARRTLYAFGQEAEIEERKTGKPLGDLFPRVIEKANKLALLFACSENAQSPTITDAAALWACDVVMHATRRLVFEAARRVSENRIESSVKRLSRIIEECGPAGVDKSGLTHKTRFLSTRERNEYLDTLIECREIVLQSLDTGHRPRAVYTHRRHVATPSTTPAA